MPTKQSEHEEHEKFKLELSGQDIYELIALLEQYAVRDDCYLRVERCVRFAELLRDAARQDGWGARATRRPPAS